MTRFRARLIVSALTLALCSMAGPALAASSLAPARGHAPAQRQTTQRQTAQGQAAAGWLARQLTGGSHLVDVYRGVSYPDQGRTIDAIFAFAAMGSADHFGARAIAWLGRPSVLAGYIGNGTTESYAGATAKVALAAEVRGISPATFGGIDLISRLSALLTPSGRYSDHSKYGDFSNAFSQSLAIIALGRQGGAPAKAARFLVSTECANGGFPLYFGLKTCVSDPDATAMVVQALLSADRMPAAEHGLRWLARVQRHRGGFVSALGGAAPNADSTGLAGQAFAAGRWFHRAALARKFLLSLQAGCSAKSSRRGAIAYNAAGFNQSTAVSATAQGILGLADVGLAKLSSRGARRDDPHLPCSA